MKTLAQKVIEDRYRKGLLTRITVFTEEDSGLPKELIDRGSVILDLFPNRPLNIEFDETALYIDLCFSGPPVRCKFSLCEIISAGDPQETRTTMSIVPMTIMEDGSLVIARPGREPPQLIVNTTEDKEPEQVIEPAPIEPVCNVIPLFPRR